MRECVECGFIYDDPSSIPLSCTQIINGQRCGGSVVTPDYDDLDDE